MALPSIGVFVSFQLCFEDVHTSQGPLYHLQTYNQPVSEHHQSNGLYTWTCVLCVSMGCPHKLHYVCMYCVCMHIASSTLVHIEVTFMSGAHFCVYMYFNMGVDCGCFTVSLECTVYPNASVLH